MKPNFSYDFDIMLLKAYAKSLAIICGTVIVLSVPMMYLWNWLMPFIFGLPELNLLQTIGLSVLINMLISKPPHNTETSIRSLSHTSDAVKEYKKMSEEVENFFRK
tara:strand:+ start:612 stop:929 length:318 start_codon:yes stop_codon:yes gene_type:complete